MDIKEGIEGRYELPLGYLRKIYGYIKKKKEEKLDYCLKKFTAYLVLSFKLNQIGVQDLLIACCEGNYICKVVAKTFTEMEVKVDSKKRVDFKRVPTIAQDVGEEGKKSRFFNKGDIPTSSSQVVSSAKLVSRKKILKTESEL